MIKYRRYWLVTALFLVAFILLAGSCAITALPEPPGITDADTVAGSAAVTPNVTESAPDQPASAAADDSLLGSDPVSGQSQEVDLSWEQLCLSSQYQVQIAKDPDFTMIVVDTGTFAPADATSPAAYYPAGGRAASPSAIGGWGNLEAGHTYYWRARVLQAATGQWMRSPWSEVKSFTVKAGMPTIRP